MRRSRPLLNLLSPPSVGLLGAPLNKGQPHLGVEQGPSLIRGVGIVEQLQRRGCQVQDFGDLEFESFPDDITEGGAKNPRSVGSATLRLSQEVQRIKRAGLMALVLGGDHSLSLGSVHGHSAVMGDLSVVWVDAHADINTPLSSGTGNMHGQPVGLLLRELQDKVPPLPGLSWLTPCLWAKNLLYIGLRDVDPGEHFILKNLGVKFFSMSDVDRMGINRVLEETCDHLLRSQKPLHLSFDVDALDPSETPATGTPVRGGLSLREGLTITEALHETGETRTRTRRDHLC
ncbi:unnamed protein product [Knipowitschia caucasica]|uniref:Arginase n=1 Tax=Knipowitschia caucasica TaxID=637954 RepID=A0AAV2JCY2_KNICA